MTTETKHPAAKPDTHAKPDAHADAKAAAPKEEAPKEPKFRLEMRHPDMDGTDVEVFAADEDAAIKLAQAQAPDGTTLHRCVPMGLYEIPSDVEGPPVSPPLPPPPPGARKDLATFFKRQPLVDPALRDKAKDAHTDEHGHKAAPDQSAAQQRHTVAQDPRARR
jgi:hypothetical protein